MTAILRQPCVPRHFNVMILLSTIGRVTAHDVAAFARDSSGIKLEALSPRDFDSRRVGPSSRDVWFIDFFAPVSSKGSIK